MNESPSPGRRSYDVMLWLSSQILFSILLTEDKRLRVLFGFIKNYKSIPFLTSQIYMFIYCSMYTCFGNTDSSTSYCKHFKTVALGGKFDAGRLKQEVFGFSDINEWWKDLLAGRKNISLLNYIFRINHSWKKCLTLFLKSFALAVHF